jgi:hypothetical protein
MVNPVVLYVPPARPVQQSSTTAVVPYQPQTDTNPLAIANAFDIQIISGNGDPPQSRTGSRWSAIGNGPGWSNAATPGEAADAYATAAQMSAGGPPTGQLMDMSV